MMKMPEATVLNKIYFLCIKFDINVFLMFWSLKLTVV